MKTDLDGLWKNQSCGLLVHLQQQALRVDIAMYGMGDEGLGTTMEASVKIVKGDLMDLMSENTNRGRLTSVLPKRDVVIIVTNTNRKVDYLGLSVLTIGGVVVPTERDNVHIGTPRFEQRPIL